MIRRTLTVHNSLGLHARAAARLVSLTSSFESRITMAREDRNECIDGKSILGILMMAAAKGTRINITVDGPDEEAAMEALNGLFEHEFNER